MGKRITPEEACARGCVSVSLVYAWCKAGILPHYRLGRAGKRGKIVIDEDDFDGFLEKMKVNGPHQENEGNLKYIK
jgi:excisionase family DNA binding protein